MKTFKLTKVEESIFNEVLTAGETSLGSVIKHLGLHKGTAYNSIRRLEEKGLVLCNLTNGLKVYSINIMALQRYGEEAKDNLKSELAKIKKIIDSSKSLRETEKESKIDTLIGFNGFKSFFEGMLDWCAKTKKEYVAIGRSSEMVRNVGEDYYKSAQMKKKRLGVKSRVILNDLSDSLPFMKNISGELRFLKSAHKSSTSTWVYGDKVAWVLWDARPIISVVIHSQSAAASFQSYFEKLWAIALSDKKVFDSRHEINLYNFFEKANKSIDILGSTCLSAVHEGRKKIIELIKKDQQVRVLLADSSTKEFQERVFTEEKFVKNVKDSRMMHEWLATVANLRDIYLRSGKSKNLSVYTYPGKIAAPMIIVDNEELMHSVNDKMMVGEYLGYHPVAILHKSLGNKNFTKVKKVFDNILNTAKPIILD
ncbi:MAG: hypothetical protein AABW73_00390 [Nanoarchaeota archaeon]